MPVKKGTKKPAVVKRNTVDKNDDVESSGSESEHMEAEPTKKSTKVVTKKDFKEKEVKENKELEAVVNNWEDHSDEEFDGEDPVVQQQVSHVENNDDNENENVENDEHKKNYKPRKQKGARYNSFNASPSLNYNRRELLECTDQVHIIPTKKLLQIVASRAKEDKQYILGDNINVILRAMNSECAYPVMNNHVHDQERSSFGQPSYNVDKKGSFERKPRK